MAEDKLALEITLGGTAVHLSDDGELGGGGLGAVGPTGARGKHSAHTWGRGQLRRRVVFTPQTIRRDMARSPPHKSSVGVNVVTVSRLHSAGETERGVCVCLRLTDQTEGKAVHDAGLPLFGGQRSEVRGQTDGGQYRHELS